MMDRCHPLPPTSVAPLRALPGNPIVLFFYARWPQWFAPRKLCFWCPALIKRGGLFSRGKVSHGICQKCSAEALEQARMEFVQRRRDRTAAIEQQFRKLALLFFALALISSGCERSEALPASAPTYRPVLHRAVSVTWSSDPTVASVEVIP